MSISKQSQVIFCCAKLPLVISIGNKFIKNKVDCIDYSVATKLLYHANTKVQNNILVKVEDF